MYKSNGSCVTEKLRLKCIWILKNVLQVQHQAPGASLKEASTHKCIIIYAHLQWTLNVLHKFPPQVNVWKDCVDVPVWVLWDPLRNTNTHTHRSKLRPQFRTSSMAEVMLIASTRAHLMNSAVTSACTADRSGVHTFAKFTLCWN